MIGGEAFVRLGSQLEQAVRTGQRHPAQEVEAGRRRRRRRVLGSRR